MAGVTLQNNHPVSKKLPYLDIGDSLDAFFLNANYLVSTSRPDRSPVYNINNPKYDRDLT